MARTTPAIWLLLLTIFSAPAWAARGSTTTIEASGIPSGFDELTRRREVLVDLYFGGEMIGAARAVVHPGYLRFEDPAKILSLVPNLNSSTEVSQVLAGDLPTNAGLVCPEGTSSGCGELSPPVAGIIFDEYHFRVDLFVNPRWLRVVRPQPSLYLPAPAAALSLTSSSGLALSGSSGEAPVYNVQNRTIIGFGRARFRSDFSYSSTAGLVADTLVGEIDTPGFRYSAGLFWAPGIDLTGQRRILGAGFGTQFDTRTDREALQGTPLVLFLSEPARVDILIDGRLVTSSRYDAGNNLLDTSTLPDGSYLVDLRIHQANGQVRDERRFFAKNPEIAPVGQPIYFAYAGKFANTEPGRPISLSRDLFYEFGTARRLNQRIAVDLSVIGASDKPLIEAGVWLITPLGRLRAAALASPRGDRGALLQVASAQSGGLNLNLDLRRIWSSDGKPLLPLPNQVDNFDSVPLDERQIGNGSFTQASGSVGYRFGTAYLAVIGSLRKDEGSPTDYSVGPDLSWPFVSRNGLQIALQANAQLTRSSKAAYVGLRMLYNRGGYSVSNSVGARAIADKSGSNPSESRAVGETTAQLSYSDEHGTDLSLAGGLTREIDSTAAHADAQIYSRLGNARAEFIQGIEGSHRTQYALTVQTGALVERDDAILGGPDLTESALIVSVEGAPADSRFEVIINDQTRAHLRAGERLPIFLQPYHGYSVRLRAIDARSVWYDSAARTFTLYPGNVQHVSWHVEHLQTIFGRAVHPNGDPVANAMISSRRGMGQSNSEGYFQIDTSAQDVLLFEAANDAGCKVKLPRTDRRLDYAPVGRVVCE